MLSAVVAPVYHDSFALSQFAFSDSDVQYTFLLRSCFEYLVSCLPVNLLMILHQILDCLVDNVTGNDMQVSARLR